MSGGRGIRRYFRLRPRGSDVAAHVEDEIRLHLELRVQQLIERGLTPERARAEAERRFGELSRVRRELERTAREREERLSMGEWLDGMRQDVRYAVRALVREPLPGAIVVLTLALGIGANAVMFGVIDRLVLRGPAHIVEPERVTRLYGTVALPARGDFTGETMGYVMYTLLRDEVQGVEGVAAYALRDGTVGRGQDAREVRFAHATRDMFALLGVQPLHGRFFAEDEDRPPQGRQVAVIDEGFWRSELGGATDVIGRTLVLNDVAHDIVGVAPAGFTGPQLEPVVAWVPMSSRPPASPDWPRTWQVQWLQVIARLAPGVTAEQAGVEATAAFRRHYTGGDPTEAAMRLSFRPLRYGPHGAETAEVKVARWLVGVSVVVLLVACANVANLLLARTLRRRREIGVRLALGVSRRRLLRLLLTESLVLALAGGVAALLLAHWGSVAVRVLLFPAVAWVDAPLSGRVLAYSAFVTLLIGFAVGLLPAAHALRQQLTASLKSGAREVGGSARARGALTIAQAALSVVLLVGAGLFVRSLWNVQRLDMGIEPERVVVVAARFPGPARPSEEEAAAALQRRRQFYERALEHVRSLPDVEAAAIAIGTAFRSSFTIRLRVPDRDSLPRLPGGGPYVAAVTAGYFETVDTRIVRGRAFTAADRAGSARVVIVNETMARTLWPGEEALGRCLLIGRDAQECAHVVGIAEPARRAGYTEEAAMQYYVPVGQEVEMGGYNLLVRPRGSAVQAQNRIRNAVYAIEPSLSYAEVFTLRDLLEPQIRPWRLGAALFTLFGALALLIAAIGLYSVIAYSVAQRRAELGIRMALGARGADIVRMIVRQGLSLVAAGIAIGIAVALLAGRYVETLLFRIGPRDPVTFVAVAAVLITIGLLASALPALRARRADPLEALRAE